MLDPVNSYLTTQALPTLGSNLRRYRDRILTRWQELVKIVLPHADPLTYEQVRNSIPKVLDQLAAALESDAPEQTARLHAVTRDHGKVRYQEGFKLRELFIEYRLLRRLLIEELRTATAGGLTVTEAMALDTGVDIALQEATLVYVEFLCSRQQPPTSDRP